MDQYSLLGFYLEAGDLWLGQIHGFVDVVEAGVRVLFWWAFEPRTPCTSDLPLFVNRYAGNPRFNQTFLGLIFTWTWRNFRSLFLWLPRKEHLMLYILPKRLKIFRASGADARIRFHVKHIFILLGSAPKMHFMFNIWSKWLEVFCWAWSHISFLSNSLLFAQFFECHVYWLLLPQRFSRSSIRPGPHSLANTGNIYWGPFGACGGRACSLAFQVLLSLGCVIIMALNYIHFY